MTSTIKIWTLMGIGDTLEPAIYIKQLSIKMIFNLSKLITCYRRLN